MELSEAQREALSISDTSALKTGTFASLLESTVVFSFDAGHVRDHLPLPGSGSYIQLAFY